VQRFDKIAYVEAVITGRPPGSKPDEDLLTALRQMPRKVRERLKGEIPIRFGSPLYSKLQKAYWTLHDVAKWPLVIAIADFHAKGSMLWTSTGLEDYLYGTHHDFSFDSDGKLIISPLKIETHKHGKKEIPSGFFFNLRPSTSAPCFSLAAARSRSLPGWESCRIWRSRGESGSSWYTLHA